MWLVGLMGRLLVSELFGRVGFGAASVATAEATTKTAIIALTIAAQCLGLQLFLEFNQLVFGVLVFP